MAKIPKRFRDLVISGERIGIHEPKECKGQTCVFHKPSRHCMRSWSMYVRFDRLGCLVERICVHGIGHPDPDSLAFVESLVPEEDRGYEGIHGCDGCCHPPSQVARLRDEPERRLADGRTLREASDG